MRAFGALFETVTLRQTLDRRMLPRHGVALTMSFSDKFSQFVAGLRDKPEGESSNAGPSTQVAPPKERVGWRTRVSSFFATKNHERSAVPLRGRRTQHLLSKIVVQNARSGSSYARWPLLSALVDMDRRPQHSVAHVTNIIEAFYCEFDPQREVNLDAVQAIVAARVPLRFLDQELRRRYGVASADPPFDCTAAEYGTWGGVIAPLAPARAAPVNACNTKNPSTAPAKPAPSDAQWFVYNGRNAVIDHTTCSVVTESGDHAGPIAATAADAAWDDPLVRELLMAGVTTHGGNMDTASVSTLSTSVANRSLCSPCMSVDE